MSSLPLAELIHSIPRLPQLSPEMQKLAEKLPDSDFGYVEYTPEGVFRRYPLFSKAWAKSAAAAAASLPHQVRAKVAESLLDRAVHLMDANDRQLLAEAGQTSTSEKNDKSGDLDYDRGSFDVERNAITKESANALAVVHFHDVGDSNALPATVKISSLAEANELADFMVKNSHLLTDKDLRAGAVGVREAYETLGYDLEDPRIKERPNGLVMKYSSTIPAYDGPSRILHDRLKALETGRLRVKTSTAIQTGKDAYEALCYGDVPTEELASKITQLDEALGIVTSLGAYETLFTPSKQHNEVFERLMDETDPENKRYRHHDYVVTGKDIKNLKYRRLDQLKPFLGRVLVEDLRADPLATFNKVDDIQKGYILEWAWRWANEGPTLPRRA